MRIFLILICSIALVSLAPEVHAGKHKGKKSGDGSAVSKSAKKAPAKSTDWTKPKGAGKPKPVNTWNDSNTVKYSKKGKNWNSVEKVTTSSNGQTYQYKYKSKVKTKHYDLSFKPNQEIQRVKFDNNYRIHGSENWRGDRYAAFRNYDNEWHDRGWWHSRYKRIGFFSGGWYYWNANHWYPAWGYAPDAYYAYDGPIYAYNNLAADQVIANVQAALQEQGYYRGEVNGWLGPPTRTALGNYQRDHRLYITSAIDRQTLQSLGME